jgi:hypothetical protein
LTNTFSVYGTFKSLNRDINPQTNQPFAFICFEDNENKELGPTWAQKAVDDLHEKVITEDGKEYRLYVSRALKMKEIE